MRVPLRMWACKVDAASLKLLKRLACNRHLAGPIAVMPDVHAAGTVCVGTVLASATAVFPTAIGEDLGCGMRVQTFEVEASALTRERLERVLAGLDATIPTGRKSHRIPQPWPHGLRQQELSTQALDHERKGLGARHLGTLGGGNHFVELQRDTGGGLWVTVHSGSRGIGAAIAAHHARVARGRSPAECLPLLELGSISARLFMADLRWALAFAAANRERMLSCVHTVLSQVLGSAITPGVCHDMPHNVIAFEPHDGRMFAIHRKGAMPAYAGVRGVLPGSMGTASYIVEGLGAAAAYASCSHGAGRQLSRREAREKITVRQLRAELRGVVFNGALEHALVEEAPSAYKDLKRVLNEQTDLVRPLLRLEPLAVLKGG